MADDGRRSLLVLAWRGGLRTGVNRDKDAARYCGPGIRRGAFGHADIIAAHKYVRSVSLSSKPDGPSP